MINMDNAINHSLQHSISSDVPQKRRFYNYFAGNPREGEITHTEVRCGGGGGFKPGMAPRCHPIKIYEH